MTIRPTALALYTERWNAGRPTGWTGFCSSPRFCTTPCLDCRKMGADVLEHPDLDPSSRIPFHPTEGTSS